MLLTTRLPEFLCRCLCGNGKREPWDHKGGLDGGTLASLEEEDEAEDIPLPHPTVAGALLYSATADQPLRGSPIRKGELWFLSPEEKVELVTCSLHVNGFSFVHNQEEVSISLSPFSLVRNCKFEGGCQSVNLSEFKLFKVALFAQERYFYYGIRCKDEERAEEERSKWVLDISRAIRLVTQSLFPPFHISCEPLHSVDATQRRLMAGYLVHHEFPAVASVLYCELHPQWEDQAKMLLWENECCQKLVLEIHLTEHTACCEKVGINCSCFSVQDHHFSSKTVAERKLWLRAISNLKVKLQNRAPTPSPEELSAYRHSIREHVAAMNDALSNKAPMDALLPRAAHVRKSVGEDAEGGWKVTDLQDNGPGKSNGARHVNGASNGVSVTAEHCLSKVGAIAVGAPSPGGRRAGPGGNLAGPPRPPDEPPQLGAG